MLEVVAEDVPCIDGKEGTSEHTVAEPRQTEIMIEIAPNGLTATASVQPTIFGDCSSLKEIPFVQDLIGEDMVEESPLTVDPRHVEKALRSHGIFVGIDVAGIAALASNPTDGSQIVARGTVPTPGQDAYIELKFEQEASFRVPADDSQKIDWRKLNHIPTVKEGDELARKHPLRLGKSGLSVTGKILPPPVPKDIELKAGEGCKVVDNTRVAATRNGRPAMVQGRIVVFPVLVREMGVTLSTGNIRFDGDVVVNGNVEDNMAVEAGGDIDINGNANHASLMAGGQIMVRNNLIGGSARAGAVGLVHLKHDMYWKRLTQRLEDCTGIMNRMTKHPELSPIMADQGWVLVLQKLVDTKFRSLRDILRHLVAGYRGVEGMLVKDVWNVLKPLQELLEKESEPGDTGIGELIRVTTLARRLQDNLKEMHENGLSFKAYYVQGTHVEASGDIVIFGPGSYQSHLYAGRSVYVQGKPGIVRGGAVYSKRIDVNEAGSAGGTPTLLGVDTKGIIKIETVHPNVTIQVGNISHKFETVDHYIVARINNHGELAIH